MTTLDHLSGSGEVAKLALSPNSNQSKGYATALTTEGAVEEKKELHPRHIVVYINGDRSSVGTYIILDCSKYQELRDFLNDLTYSLPKQIYLPCGVQRIFTPKGRHRVRAMSDLKDGLSYVCTGFEPMKRLNYGAKDLGKVEGEASNRHKPHYPAIDSNFNRADMQPAGGDTCKHFTVSPQCSKARTRKSQNARLLCHRQQEQLLLESQSKGNGNIAPLHAVHRLEPVRITVLPKTLELITNNRQSRGARNILVLRLNRAESELTAIQVTLSRLAVQTIGQVMCEISTAFGPRWNNDPIRYLYHLTGREVRSINDLFQRESKVFIGTGIQRIFGRTSESEEVPITGDDIRVILQRFWPDHPDPGSVVHQWEQRTSRYQDIVRRGVEDTEKPVPGASLFIAEAPTSNVVKNDSFSKGEHAVNRQEPKSIHPPDHVAGEGQRDSGFVDAGTSPELDESAMLAATASHTKATANKLPQLTKKVSEDTMQHSRPSRSDNNRRIHRGKNTQSLLSSQVSGTLGVPPIQLQESEQQKLPTAQASVSPAGLRRNLPPLRAKQLGSRLTPTSQVAFRPALANNNVPEHNTPCVAAQRRVFNNLPATHQSTALLQPTIDRAQRHERSRASSHTSPHPSAAVLENTRDKIHIPIVSLSSRLDNQSRSVDRTRTKSKDPMTDDRIIDETLHPKSSKSKSICTSKARGKLKTGSAIKKNGKPKQTHRGRSPTALDNKSGSKVDAKVFDANVPPVQQEIDELDNVEEQHQVRGEVKITGSEKGQSIMHTCTQTPKAEESGGQVQTKDMPVELGQVFKNVSEELVQKVPTRQERNLSKSNELKNLKLKFISDVQFLQKRYHIGRILGDGNFAVVRLVRRRDTGQQYAMKIIDKAKLKGKETMLHQEVTILHACNHPNIVRLIEEYETPKEIWLVMELVKDGDLFEGITKSVKYTENVAAAIVADIANALFYLHCRYIVHRDLKPENILMWRQSDGKLRVKLADFGLALEVRRNLYTVCGTPTYIAPEILAERGYGLEVDLWALGIITYIMLCGFAPFRSPDRRQSKLFESIKRGVFVFLSPYWDEVSEGAKDLVNRLLVVTPRKRLTAIETLIHPWVYSEGAASTSDNADYKAAFEKRREAYKKELEREAHAVRARKLSTDNSTMMASMLLSSSNPDSHSYMQFKS